MNEPYVPLPTFIREQWTKAVMRVVNRQKHMAWVMTFLLVLSVNCFLAFFLPAMLLEKYTAGLAGYTALGLRFYNWLKSMKEKR